MVELTTDPSRLLLLFRHARERYNSAKHHYHCAVILRLSGWIGMPQVCESSAYHRVSCETEVSVCGKKVTPE
jgi:hypothetical protein